MDDVAIRIVDIIGKRIGHLETNSVTERTARMDAEQQHVQTPTAQLQTSTSKPDNPGSSSVDRADRHKGVGKFGNVDASAKGAWNDWELVMLTYIGQLDRNQTNAMKNSAASETHVVKTAAGLFTSNS